MPMSRHLVCFAQWIGEVKNQICPLCQILASGLWPYLVRVFSRIRPPDLRPDKDSRGSEVEAISTVKEAVYQRQPVSKLKETKVCLWASPKESVGAPDQMTVSKHNKSEGMGATSLTCCVG